MTDTPDPQSGSNTRSHSFLAVDPRPVASLLVTSDGEPVWPANSAADLRALELLANTFGATVREVRGQPGEIPNPSGFVIGLGRDVEEEAHLYAHLTSRSLRCVDTIAGLSEAEPASVIVTTARFLHQELFEFLWSHSHALTVPGIVCGGFGSCLRQQVLVRSAAASLTGPLVDRRIDLLLAGDIQEQDGSAHEVIGLSAGPQRVREALAKQAGVLTVLAHCDGIDAHLGDGLTLCPMDYFLLHGDPNRRPRCVDTGYCHRHSASIEETLGTGALLQPETIAARILVWRTCWGVLPPDGTVDPVWGLLPRFLASPTVGAIVTSPGVVLVSAALTRPLADHLANGARVGDVLAELARLPENRRLAQRYLLFGDPQVRLPPRISNADSSLPVQTRTIASRPPMDHPRQAGFLLRMILHDIASGNVEQDLSGPAHEALEALSAYESALWLERQTEGAPDAPGPTLRRAIMPCLCRRGPDVSEAWLRYAGLETDEGSPGAICFACRQSRNTLTTLQAWFPLLEISRRRIAFCPRCGFVEDAPVDSTVTFQVVDGRSVWLEGELPKDHWTAALLMKPMVPEERIWWDWPAGTDGRPALTFEPPRPWPIGQLEIAVIMLSEARLTILCTRDRRDGADSFG